MGQVWPISGEVVITDGEVIVPLGSEEVTVGDFIATKRKSSLALKLETTAIATITADSSGSPATTITYSSTGHGLVVGDVVGSDTLGWRTVVGGITTLVVVVDSPFDVALSTDLTWKQSFGTDPTIVVGDVINFVDFSIEADIGEIPVDDVNRSFDENEPVLGSQVVSGNIELSLRGSGTPGTAPESDDLWISAVGEKSVNAAAATHATVVCTINTLNMVSSDGAKFKLGQHILLPTDYDDSAAVKTVVRITAISTDEITFTPAALVAGIDKVIAEGVHYRPTVTELHSFWCKFWRGDITVENFEGCKVSSLALDFQSGQSVKAVFTVDGKQMSTPVAGAYDLATASLNASAVQVARNMSVTMDGVAYPVSKVTIQIDNEIFRREDVSTSGTRSLIRTKRTVTGSFELLYENETIEGLFIAGTTAELQIVCSDGSAAKLAGNIFALSCPKIKYTKVTKSEDSGLYSYGPTFKAVRGGTTELLEDSIFMSFL